MTVGARPGEDLGAYHDRMLAERGRVEIRKRYQPVGPAGRGDPARSRPLPFGERLQGLVELAASSDRQIAQAARQELQSLVGGSAAGALTKAVDGGLKPADATASYLAGRVAGSP